MALHIRRRTAILKVIEFCAARTFHLKGNSLSRGAGNSSDGIGIARNECNIAIVTANRGGGVVGRRLCSNRPEHAKLDVAVTAETIRGCC